MRHHRFVVSLALLAACGSLDTAGQRASSMSSVATTPASISRSISTPTSTTGAGSATSMATLANPTTTSTTSATGGAPLTSTQAVVWRFSGQLQVIDTTDGSVVRQLAEIAVGYPAPGPASVTLTHDRRMAIVEWNRGEPGCLTEVGAAATDGSGTIQDWGPGADEAAVSPDGTRAAWYAVGPIDCSNHQLVIRELATGHERRIDVASANGHVAGGGPWWRADNATLVVRLRDPGSSDPEAGTEAVTVDASSEGPLHPMSTVPLGCVEPVSELFAQQTHAGGEVVSIDVEEATGRSKVVRCPLDGSAGTTLLGAAETYRYAMLDRAGEHVLLISLDGHLATAPVDGNPRVLPVDKVQSASW